MSRRLPATALCSIAIACGPSNGYPTDNMVETPDGDFVVDYPPDSGVACVTAREGQPLSVFVDFGDCFDCSTNQLWCDVIDEGDGTIRVHGGGTVLIEDECSTGGTCENTTADCTAVAPVLAPGIYTLSYGGVEVPFTLPSGSWTCTGTSALARVAGAP
jgi:hypothetical protein